MRCSTGAARDNAKPVLRFRFPWLLIALGAASCGGSSSETPFPVEPDWRREAKNTGPQRELVFSGERTKSEDESEETGEPDPGEAPGTWGPSESDAPPSRPRKSEEELELELE